MFHIFSLTHESFPSLAHEDPNQEESEIFLKADFNLPIATAEAKLLYFLSLGFTGLDIAFGAGIFLNFDKAHGMRRMDDPNSVKYGRITLDEIQNKVPNLKDLFVVCAAGKCGDCTYVIYLMV